MDDKSLKGASRSSVEKLYVILCTVFSVLIVTGNLIYQKFVFLPLGFWTFQLSVGAIIYPITFLVTDLIAEFYGKERARFCVYLGISMNVLVVGIISFAVSLEATPWSHLTSAEFQKVFGFYSVAFLGSVLANYIAQSVDIVLYLGIRRLTQGKLLWLRNTVSTATSLAIDTVIVVSVLAFFGAIPREQWGVLIKNSYSFKFFFTLANVPLFYLWVYGIRKFWGLVEK